MATDTISTRLGIEGTCSANTCRSGSDMVMMKPSRNDRATTTLSLRLRVMQVPTRSPMGVMAISAPSVKNIMPAIRNTAPTRNVSTMPGEMGATLKQSTMTMSRIGRTAFRDSISLPYRREPCEIEQRLHFRSSSHFQLYSICQKKSIESCRTVACFQNFLPIITVLRREIDE